MTRPVSSRSTALRHLIRPAALACGVSALLLASACASPGQAGAGGATGGADTSSASPSPLAPAPTASSTTAPTSTASAVSPASASASPSASSPSAPAASSPAASSGRLPLMALQRLDAKDEAAVKGAIEGEAHLPALPADVVTRTTKAAFDAEKVTCAGAIAPGAETRCVVEMRAEGGPATTRTMRARTVVGGAANVGVLYVEESAQLPAPVVKALAGDSGIVLGQEKGTGYLMQDHGATELAKDVTSMIQSKNTRLPWGSEDVDGVTCDGALASKKFAATSCTLRIGGLEGPAYVLPAQWAGAGAEPGLLIVADLPE